MKLMDAIGSHRDEKNRGRAAVLVILVVGVLIGATCLFGLGSFARGGWTNQEKKKLSHEETLRWIDEHKAWKLAKKTKPIFARKVRSDEVGKEFKTADHSIEKAKKDYWLCVGIAGEPWFQTLEKIEGKYKHACDQKKSFNFDMSAQEYRIYEPKSEVRNLVAQVKGDNIAGFFIKPNYDPEHPLYSPTGGFVVTDVVNDPYKVKLKDVWLVQEDLFNSTYEIIP